MTRAFVAIRPPPPVLDAIEARVAPVAMPGRTAASRDQWHITVQFLGNDAELAAVATAFEHEPLDLGAAEIRFGGADALGSRRRARILALVLHEGAEWVRELAAQVERRLAPLGHVRDRPGGDVPAPSHARPVPAPLRPAAVVCRGRPRAGRPGVAGRRGRALRERAASAGRAARGPGASADRSLNSRDSTSPVT